MSMEELAQEAQGLQFEDLATATIEEPSAAPVESAPESTPDPTPSAAPAPAPADPNQAAGAQWQSIREAAQAQGYNFGPNISDDRSALQHLLQQAHQARQSDIYSQLGRQLAPKAEAIQQYLKQQQTPAPQARPVWEAPEWDARWAHLVERDPNTGVVIGKPGCPPAIVEKVNTYLDWKEKYDQNPVAVINGMVEERARKIAEETYKAQWAEQQRETEIQTIVRENAAWLYQTNQDGSRAVDYRGQFIPSPVGSRYLHYLQQVQSAGVTNPRQQDAMAKQFVRGEYAQAYYAQQEQQRASAPMTQAAAARPNVNPLQATPPAARQATPGATESTTTGLSLNDLLKRALKEEGVQDQDFENLS